MKINIVDDAIAFLFHNADVYLKLISLVKTAFNYGRGDKQICKKFSYTFGKESKKYNKVDLIQLGRLANGHSYTYLHNPKNRSKFKMYNRCKNIYVDLDDTDIEFIGYYQVGLFVIKLYEKVKFILKNRKNGITQSKCVNIKIPAYMNHLLAWKHLELKGTFCMDTDNLVTIFKNSSSTMYKLYYDHLNSILVDHSNIEVLDKAHNLLTNSNVGSVLRYKNQIGNYNITQNNYTIVNGVLTISFEEAKIWKNSLASKNNNLLYTLMISKKGNDEYRMVDLTRIKDTLTDLNQFNIGNAIFYGLKPDISYKFDLKIKHIREA